MDHAQFGGHLLLVAVDTFSKWPEVHIFSSTSAQQTIDKLWYIFACYGLPTTLVSDNGPPFQSAEFSHFVTANGILHCRVPPYHPSTVREYGQNYSIKHTLSKTKINKDVTLDTHITRFLATYWNIQCTPTSGIPAELLLNRAP